MMRAPETPLILWICAAVCAHFMFAEGGDQIATYHEDRSYLYQLASRTRSIVHGKDQTIEIVTNEEGQPTEESPEQKKEEEKKKAADEKKAEAKPEEAKKPDPKKADAPQPTSRSSPRKTIR
jgi:hypothetical protein